MRKQKLPLRWKLTLNNALVVFLLLLVFVVGMLAFLALEVFREKRVELTLAHQDLLTQVTDLNAEQLNGISLPASIAFSVSRPDGSTVYASSSDMIGPSLRDEAGRLALVESPSEKNAEERLFIYAGSWLNGEERLFLQTTIDISSALELLEGIPLALALTFLAGLVMSFLAGQYMSRKMLTPVRAISRKISSVTAETLFTRIPQEQTDEEFQMLAASFNDMIERLEQSFQKQKDFVSSASHELKTPLAVMKGHTSMLQRWGKRDEKVLTESLDTLSGEIDRMTLLVDQLLALARQDRAEIKLKPERFAIAGLFAELKEETLLTAADAAVRVQCPEDLQMTGDRDAVKQVLRILMDNSRKYCIPPVITLAAAEDGETVALSVRDEGRGIPPEKLPYIFDRFYRVEESRTTEGNGLGLAIAKGLAGLMNGWIGAESKLGCYTKITVFLPKDGT